MKIPPAPHFTPLTLDHTFTVDSQTLTDGLRPPSDAAQYTGVQQILGMPFRCGPPDGANAILLDKEPVLLDLAGYGATYVLFLHMVEDRITNYLEGFADSAVDGNELGHLVAEYTLEFADGATTTVPIRRRFAIQQPRIRWGASAFEAVPARPPSVFHTVTEDLGLGRMPVDSYGFGETRHGSGRLGEQLWIYALPNPHPEKPLQRLVLTPRGERALIFAITLTDVTEHPLRPGVRQKARLVLPSGVTLNQLGELDDIAIDLGTVISARAALTYDADRWLGAEPNVQPTRSATEVIVEYTAHPQARLYVGNGSAEPLIYELAALAAGTVSPGLTTVNPAWRPVTVRVVEAETGQPAPVRVHFHGQHGEYLPPRGNHRKVNPYWFEDNYGEFVNGLNQYAYIRGECIVDLPLGEVFVEITRGYEVQPLRTHFTVTAETAEIVFAVAKVLHWRAAGWVTADTHVHFLSPTTALLEGQAEDVHVVNLLASQWGEMFSNVTDFDGQTTLGAKEFGGNGEFLVRVGTENRMQVLGHISLLGYRGAMIHPLCTGGPAESALGDSQEVTMAEWAQRCIDQGGLVVMPHAPNPQLERAADMVLGLIQGMELMTFNPHDNQLNPYGIADWYRYLNLGYQVPLVGGSDKMGQAWLLGGVRTYAHLGGLPFTYENWLAAVKAGNTFVTVGPLVELRVENAVPGHTLDLPVGGGPVHVTWRVESVRLPVEQVEVVVGGLVAEQINLGATLAASGTVTVSIPASTWIALRVRGSYGAKTGDIAAHTSAVLVRVGGQALFVQQDAFAVLEQIEGALAYVDTLAPRPAARRFQQLRATLEAAYNRLHQRMHRAGIFHQHTSVHLPA
jgi:hypothetical protein